MIEARTNPGEATQKNQTPNTITVTMILEDLDNGIDRTAIQEKYGLEKWEVTQMFQHPALKGKKARKIRKLSFNFVDDTAADPNQTTIPDAIEEATPELSDKIFMVEEDEEDPLIGKYGEEDEF